MPWLDSLAIQANTLEARTDGKECRDIEQRAGWHHGAGGGRQTVAYRLRSFAAGVIGDGRAKSRSTTDSGTVVTTRQVNIFALPTEKVGAVAGYTLDT